MGACRWVRSRPLCRLCGGVKIFISFTSVCLEDAQAWCTLMRRPNSCHHSFALFAGYSPERLWHPRWPHIAGSPFIPVSPTHCSLTSVILVIVKREKRGSCETLSRPMVEGQGTRSKLSEVFTELV